jgi:hypothetical protein
VQANQIALTKETSLLAHEPARKEEDTLCTDDNVHYENRETKFHTYLNVSPTSGNIQEEW